MRPNPPSIPPAANASRSQTRHILIMIRHEGVAKSPQHDEPQHRTQCRRKKQPRHFHAPPQPPPRPPNHQPRSRRRQQPDISGRIRRRNCPARITKRQLRRPKQFAQIKPERPAGNQRPLHRPNGENLPLRALMEAFPPDRHQTHADAQSHKRAHLRPLPPTNGHLLEPQHQQQRRRQCASRRLGAERQRVTNQCQPVI